MATTQYQLIPVDYVSVSGGFTLSPHWNKQNYSASPSGVVYTRGGSFGGILPYNNALYAYTEDSRATGFTGHGAAIWKSTDNGATWSQLAPPPFTSSTGQGWDTGWVACWNPAVSHVITFVGYATTGIDFDLSTEKWGTFYATNALAQLPVQRLAQRLSDGRIRLIYNTGETNRPIYWAVGNTSGSGVWDSSYNPVAATPPPGYAGVYFVQNPGGSYVDSANRMHWWWWWSLADSVTANPTGTPYTRYGSVDTANTVVVQENPFDGAKVRSTMIVGPDGKLYVGAVGVTATNSIDVYVGTGLANPVWTTQQIAVGAFPPDSLFLQVSSGSLTMVWEEQDPSHNTQLKIKMSTLSGSIWQTQVLWDLATTTVMSSFPAPVTPGPAWIGEGLSWYAAPNLAYGIGLLIALDVSADANQTSGTATFTLNPYAVTVTQNYGYTG